MYGALVARAESEGYTQDEANDALRTLKLSEDDPVRRDISDVMDALYELGD